MEGVGAHERLANAQGFFAEAGLETRTSSSVTPNFSAPLRESAVS